MPSVADVYSDPSKLGLEHRMTGIAFVVVGRLVEVAHPRNVILTVLAHVVSVVGNHYRRVPQGVVVIGIPLQDRRDDHHVVLLGQFLHQFGGWTILGILGKLAPWELLPSAERERHS